MNCIAILVVLLATLGARADAIARPGPEAEEPAASVRAYMDTLEQAGFSGAVLVELHGKIVISKGYGYSDALAIGNYRKSLPLDPGNANAEEVLKRLAGNVGDP